MEQALYRVSNVMKRLDVCRATIYRMIARGDLEIVKVGRATRITSSSLDRVISGVRVKD